MEYIKSEHYDIMRNDYGRELVIPSEKEWAEVKHGTWKHTKDGIIISGYCSECGWVSAVGETDVAGMPYCPNCGARLEDGDE